MRALADHTLEDRAVGVSFGAWLAVFDASTMRLVTDVCRGRLVVWPTEDMRLVCELLGGSSRFHYAIDAAPRFSMLIFVAASS